MVIKAIKTYIEEDYDTYLNFPCHLDIGDLFFDEILQETLVKMFGFKKIDFESSVEYGGESLFRDDFRHRDRKNFKEYDVIYFIDSNKKDWLKFRMNKNILILDNITKKKDKYNSHLLEFNTYIQRRDVDKKNMQYLCNQYNNLELAIVISLLWS